MSSLDSNKKSIDSWVEEVKQILKNLEENNDIDSLKLEFFKSAEMVMDFNNTVFSNLAAKAKEIISIATKSYQAMGKEIKGKISIDLEGQEIIVDTEIRGSEQQTIMIFPMVKKALEILDEFCEKLGEIPSKFFTIARENVNSILDEEEKLVMKLEKQIFRAPPPESDELVSLIQEINLSRSNAENQIKLNSFRGKDLVIEFRKHAPGLKRFQDVKIYKYKLRNGYLDFSTWFNDTVMTEELNQRRKEIERSFGPVGQRIQELTSLGKVSDKMLDTISNMDPEFPINLQRLSELIEIDKEKTEKTLEYVLEINPSIGKYDRTSQMLIISKSSKKLRRVKKKCPECDSEIKSTSNECPNCGKEFDICQICRGIITTERTKNCSSCGRIFHKNHLEEWMNTNSNCPVCKSKL